MPNQPTPRSRPSDRDRPEPVVEAVGKISEAFEFVERARGHLYSFHQLMGRADFLMEEGGDLLRNAGLDDDATVVAEEVVGRNVLDGRWTFQVVDEFDAIYYSFVQNVLRDLEARHLDGRRHVYESMLKEQRRSPGRPGHERRPPGAHSPVVDTEQG
jgi:hypothetical protein